MNARLSVVVITKNEATNLAACLESVSWADEIVILDSGSTDETLSIAKKYTEKVYSNVDWPGFGVQRQRAQSYANGEWVFAIDADERVSPQLKEQLLNAVNGDDRTKIYAVPRLTWAFGSYIRHSGWYPDYVVRLYHRDTASYDNALVHEKVTYGEDIELVRLTGDLYHYTFENLEQWVNKTAMFAAAWAKERHQRGKRGSLFAAIVHAGSYFVKTYLLRRGFLDGQAGLLLALLGAYSRVLKYADLWLYQQSERPDRQ